MKMGDVPQSPRARGGPETCSTGASQSAPSSPSSPFAHLVHRTSYIDLKALASPSDEEEDRFTDWSAFVDDSPTQRRRKINPGRLSTQFVSPAEESALRSGSKRWARPGSDFVPPLLPELSDIDAEGKEAKGTAGSKGNRDFAPVSSNFSDENEEAMGEAGSNSSPGSMFSIFSAGSGGNESGKSQGMVRFFQSDSSANGPGSVHSYRSKSSGRSMSGTGARRTSNSVRSILSVESDDQSSTTPLRSGSESRLKRQRTTDPSENSNDNHCREVSKSIPDDTRTEVTDGSDKSVVGDLEAADIPLEHVNMSYFHSHRDTHMSEDFNRKKKKRRIGLGCILLVLLLALIALIVGLSVSNQEKQQSGDNTNAQPNGGNTIVAGINEPIGGAAVVADSNSSSVPNGFQLTQTPTSEPTLTPTLEPTIAKASANLPELPTSSDYTSLTPSPTASPTNHPSLNPTEGGTMDWLLALLMKHSPYPERLIARGRNAQKRAYMWLAEDPNVREYSVRRILQRWVLATAFFSQKDPWLWNDWKKHPNECYWTGIRCSFMNKAEDVGGEWVVTSVNVAHAFLEGVIPEEISLLEHLTNLNLHGNAFLAHGFHGTIPTELGKLQHLKYLNLSSNNFEGTVPTELAGLPELKDLRLARNSLEGDMPQELCQRSNMCHLSADCEEVQCDYGCCTRCCKDDGLCCNKNGWCFF